MKSFNGNKGLYNYDTSLFYRNDRVFEGADPGVLWVSVEDDSTYGGYFYCVVTGGEKNDGTSTSGAFTCYRSKDLNCWEVCGAVKGKFALKINPTDWCEQDFWAPEYFHEKITVDGKIKNRYYLYFNALSKQGNGETEYTSSTLEEGRFNRFYLGIAVSDSPCGPFTLVDTSTYYNFYGQDRKEDLNGNKITGSTPTFNFFKNNPEILTEYRRRGIKADYWPAIDISPFLDPATGEFYCYFSHHPSTYSYDIFIWVVKMKDFITPDYTSMHVVALPGYTVDSTDFKLYVNDAKTDYSAMPKLKDKLTRFYYDGSECAVGINEGAHTIAYYDKNADKWLYYLTYSPFGFPSRAYSILQAVSLSPYGPFKKLPPHEGQVVIGILNWDKNSHEVGKDCLDYSCKHDLSSSIDYASGCGHHSFAKVNGEVFAVYHSLYNSLSNYADGRFMGRQITADKVLWTYSPTLTYKNIEERGEGCNLPLPLLYGLGPTNSLQPLAKGVGDCVDITCDCSVTVEGKHFNAEGLKSCGFVVHSVYKGREFACEGDAVIKVKFAEPQKLRAIILYNSCELDFALKSVCRAEIILPSGQVEIIENLSQNGENVTDYNTMRYGGAIVADFKQIEAVGVNLYLKAEDKFNTANCQIKTGSLVLLANQGNGVNEAVFGNGLGVTFDIDNTCSYQKEFEFKGGKINCLVATNGQKYKVVALYQGKVFHADDNGVQGKFEGYERWYKNTSIKVTSGANFAEACAYTVRAKGANANIIERSAQGLEQDKLLAEFYFNSQPTDIEVVVPSSEKDLAPKSYKFCLKG